MSKTSLEKRLNEKRVDWSAISRDEKLTEDFMRKYSKKIKWNIICYSQKLSEAFIEEFINKIYWEEICTWQTLSEDFIRKYKDKVDWREISEHQILSNDFICEFKDKVDWFFVCKHQTLSMECMRACSEYLFWEHIYIYQEFDQEFKNEFKDKLPQTSYIERRCAFFPKTLDETFQIIKEHVAKEKACNGELVFNKQRLTFSYRFNPEYYGNGFIDLNLSYYSSIKKPFADKVFEVKGETNRYSKSFNIPIEKINRIEEKINSFLKNKGNIIL